MKKLNNRLLNQSCDQSSVSKRTISRWNKIFADASKRTKLDVELSGERDLVGQKCHTDSKSTKVGDNFNTDDENTVSDIYDTEIDDKNFSDSASIDSSCDDIYSMCSCCGSDINSDDDDCNVESKDPSENLFEAYRLEIDRLMFSAANLKITDVLLIIEMFSISKNLTKSDQNDLLKLVKVLVGPDFESWDCSYYSRSKIFGVTEDKITLIFFCENCNVILKKKNFQNCSKKEKVQCQKCKKDFSISSQATNYFMSLDIRYQIQLILNQEQIQNNFFNYIATENRSSNISDIRDSNLYKELKKQLPDTFTLNYNTDGAPIFKSSKQSFWPQLVINELPLEERFKHIILGGIFLTDAEPKPEFMNLYNEVLCDQLVDLMNNGVNIFNYATKQNCNLKFTLLCCCVDTPARATCQNRVKFSSYYGCSWCYEPGLYVEHAVHYPLSEIKPSLRTHRDHIANVNELEKIKKTSDSKSKVPTVMGVKGSTIFIEKLPLFDSIWGFPIDYMHGCLLGVTRQVLQLLKTPGVKFQLTKKQREAIDKRLISIQPPHEIYRLPRPTGDMCKWKASEFESWLLYWSLLCLDGIADPELLEMYALYVRSIFTLLKRKITIEEITRTQYDLAKFVGLFQIEFSKSSMTFNLHSLWHLCKSVLQTGPLIGTSTFASENESSECRRFCRELFTHDELKADFLKLSDELVLAGKIRIHEEIQNKIKSLINDNTVVIHAYKKCIYKKTVIHSTNYTRATKTNDTCVQLQSGQIIRIHHLIVIKEQCYIYGRPLNINPYSIGNVEIDHIHRITNSCENDSIIMCISNFKEKVIFVEIEQSQYICFFPYILNMN